MCGGRVTRARNKEKHVPSRPRVRVASRARISLSIQGVSHTTTTLLFKPRSYLVHFHVGRFSRAHPIYINRRRTPASCNVLQNTFSLLPVRACVEKDRQRRNAECDICRIR